MQGDIQYGLLIMYASFKIARVVISPSCFALINIKLEEHTNSDGDSSLILGVSNEGHLQR